MSVARQKLYILNGALAVRRENDQIKGLSAIVIEILNTQGRVRKHSY